MSKQMLMALLATILVGTASTTTAQAFDLFEIIDQAEARRLNVQADNVEIVRMPRGSVSMFDGGFSIRTSNCLKGADCSRRPITAGNYLRIEGKAPWLINVGYIGMVKNRSRLHEKGDLTAMNVLEVPAGSIRPGGLHVRSFSLGGTQQTIRP